MKTIVITGGAKGLGLGFARALKSSANQIYLIDIDKSEQSSLEKEGFHFIQADVSKPESWSALDTKISHLDVLINNAGSLCNHEGPQNPEMMTLQNWRDTHRINLDSVFLGCQWAIQKMKSNSNLSSIINLSSRSGKVGVPGLAAYASSKAAILNYTKSVALYCAEQKYPIVCNALVPASIYTPLWENLWGVNAKAKKEEAARQIPAGRMGETRDLDALIRFLALEVSSYITGAEFVVDGGVLAGTASSPK